MTERNTISAAQIALLAGLTFFVAGCHHHTQVAYQPPPPPTGAKTPAHAKTSTDDSSADVHGKPVFSEVGTASWYGVNPNHRSAADGSIYDENAMTAAHRTLPM